MSNILKSGAKVHGAKTFLTSFYDAGGADRIYMGLGNHGAPWSVPETPDVPLDNYQQEQDFWDNLIGIGVVTQATDTELVIPKKTWTVGATYVKQSVSTALGSGTFDTGSGRNFYVANTELAPKVYVCLLAGGGVVADEPTHTDPNGVVEADGYNWAYLYTIGGGGHVNSALSTVSWMPVPGISSSGVLAYVTGTPYGLGGLAFGDGTGNFDAGQVYQVTATTGSSSGDMNVDAGNTWAAWYGDMLLGAFWVSAQVAFIPSDSGGLPNGVYRQVALLRNTLNAAGARNYAPWEPTDFEVTLSRGVVLTLDNRVAITRANGQTETVRIILEF
jgi:hypothetical protein